MITRRMVLATGVAGVAGVAASACGSGAQAQATLKMSAPRAAHSVLAMRDGSVLFIGGCVADSCETGPASATVDRYDPATRQISRAGNLRGPRMQAAVTELPDGAVLIAGGWSGGRTSSIERFDPERGVSEKVGELSAAQVCAPIELADGRVLIMGQETVEVVDTRRLHVTPLSKTSPWMDSSSATLLRNGKVLVAGGRVSGPPAAEAWLFDPATANTVATGGLSAPRRKHAAVRLNDGRVLLVGGSGERDRGNKYRGMEAYDPATGKFTRVGETREARFKIPDAVVVLKSGKVLVAGGADYPELIDPEDWSVRRVDTRLGAMLNFASAVLLANGDVLVAGGYAETTINPTDQAWIIPHALLS